MKTEEIVKKLKEDSKKWKSKVKNVTDELEKERGDKSAFEDQIKQLKE